MESKQELLTQLQQIISEQLGVQKEEITAGSTWIQLGADSLDRLEMSLAVEEAFHVDIPHSVGERLNSVGETVDHLSARIAAQKDATNVRIEAVTTNQQWAEMAKIRTQVFTIEYGFSFRPLAGPAKPGVWHLLVRQNFDAIGTLSVIDTTVDRRLHRRYQLSFGAKERVARYAQLALLRPYRKRGIFEMLMKAAQNTIIRPNGFTVGWLLYPAAHVHSSMLTQQLGFSAGTPVLATEFGSCRALIRRESSLQTVTVNEEFLHIVETCPI